MAELQALYMALQYVEGIFSKKTCVICTDSLSSLQAIGKNTIKYNVGLQIIETLLPVYHGKSYSAHVGP